MMKPLNKFEIGLVSLTYNSSERERKERGKCVIVKDLSGSGVLRACCTRSAHRQQLHHLFFMIIFYDADCDLLFYRFSHLYDDSSTGNDDAWNDHVISDVDLTCKSTSNGSFGYERIQSDVPCRPRPW